MAADAAERLFRAVAAADALMGSDALEATLFALDSVCCKSFNTGAQMLQGGCSVLSMIGDAGMGAMSSIGNFGIWSMEALMQPEEGRPSFEGVTPEAEISEPARARVRISRTSLDNATDAPNEASTSAVPQGSQASASTRRASLQPAKVSDFI
eukprot:TRINITY_DN78576_c0_g1_i1.p1 TRINITY_DN78576_c0_g1~~TRINITY_DN78576_c0_g1_i1.p1  ORF type:complete len:165 (+),score=35.46 TRINITY_DN78576_c0_g1_i1:37-495(+)